MGSNSKKEDKRIVKKTITSQRNTQITLSKKIDIRVGDKVDYVYNQSEDGKVIDVDLFLNDVLICKLSTDELNEFLELFFQVPN